jgi:general secretion pathway protein J
MSRFHSIVSIKDPLRSSGGFTLLELLVATMMFAIVIGALYSVSYGALKMREKAYATFEEELPIRYVIPVIRRDLAGALVPAGVLAGPLLGEKSEEGDRRLDRLEIYASTGVIDGKYPWADVQKVKYSLADPENATEGGGKDLVRAVTRNLLYESEEEIEEQHLLTGVQSLELDYYDGEAWQDAWDSTTKENALPIAARVRITFTDAGPAERKRSPLEMMIPIAAKAPTTQESGTQKGTNG